MATTAQDESHSAAWRGGRIERKSAETLPSMNRRETAVPACGWHFQERQGRNGPTPPSSSPTCAGRKSPRAQPASRRIVARFSRCRLSRRGSSGAFDRSSPWSVRCRPVGCDRRPCLWTSCPPPTESRATAHPGSMWACRGCGCLPRERVGASERARPCVVVHDHEPIAIDRGRAPAIQERDLRSVR